jgi:DNA-binding response OmpR family regulator
VQRTGLLLRQDGLNGGTVPPQRTILVVTTRPGSLEPFITALGQEPGWEVVQVDSAQAGIDGVRCETPALVVVDQKVGTLSGLDVIRRLLPVNAFIHTAVLSELDDAAFHEQGEGLGILAKLPVTPGEEDARGLLARLRQMGGDQSY